ncbi:hypothetical protein NC651_030644 [Populus alba x Populus x berolinensis]|nr:hypothetical protein NC651_030644 [Populus alba x Populus x berolinensis]
MASASSTLVFFSLLAIPFAVVQIAMAGDPDIVSDFLIPPNVTTFDGSFFTFTSALKVSKLLFLANGSLQVGFVDTTSKLFTQTLQAGDMFIFPKLWRSLLLEVLVQGPYHFLPPFSPRALTITSWPWPSRLMLPPFKLSKAGLAPKI